MKLSSLLHKSVGKASMSFLLEFCTTEDLRKVVVLYIQMKNEAVSIILFSSSDNSSVTLLAYLRVKMYSPSAMNLNKELLSFKNIKFYLAGLSF
jgi:hypothetical protein